MDKTTTINIGSSVQQPNKEVVTNKKLLPTLSTVIFVKENGKIIGEKEDETHKDQDAESKDATSINALHVFSVVGVCILLSSPVILIPQHDAIMFPQYWYELLLTFSITYPIHWTLLAILDNKFLLKITDLTTPKTCLILGLAPMIGFIVVYCSLYLFWAFHLGYNFPMPLACFISQIMWLVFMFTLWCQFPKDIRLDKESRKRLKSFVWYLIWVFLISYVYNTLQMMLKKMPQKAQPIMAIILPMMRSIDAKVLKAFISKCTLSGDLMVESYSTIISNVNFLLYVTISISTTCTDQTIFCILLVDIILSLHHCYGVMKLHRKVNLDESQIKRREMEKENEIKLLALSEILEILIPLSYTVTFVIAYYGPNATILRSIKNDYWGNTSVGNIGKVLETELLLFSVDFGILVISSILLRYFCKINLLKEFCGVLRTYWILIAVVAGALISKVNQKLKYRDFRLNEKI